MTDKEKLDFVIAEIERRLLGDYNSENNEFDIIAQGVCASILYFAKSVQEQPSAQPSKMSVEAAMAELDEKIKAFSEKTKGESAEQILAEMRGEEPVSERFAFKAIPRLLEMIEPTDRAKAYTAKLADILDAEGYSTDAKIVRESLKIMNGEKVAMATMDEELVSEPNKELAETYLTVFDKRFPILPTLKGKQLADYKNFLNKCQQIFGLKEWGIRPTQAKLFEKLSLLWAAWGAEHLQGVGRQDEKEQDISVSDDLEEEITKVYRSHIDLMMTRSQFSTLVYHFTDWQKEQMEKDSIEGQVSWLANERTGMKEVRAELPMGVPFGFGEKLRIIILKEE